MPRYDTPQPIIATISLAIGAVHITAADDTDTMVEVLPSDDASERDVQTAEQTTVDFASNSLTVKGPRLPRFGVAAKPGSIDIRIRLPAGSQIHVTGDLAAFTSAGRLGRCRVHTEVGDIHVAEARETDLKSGFGSITLDHGGGRAEISTGSGRLQVGAIDGPAELKNSNGETSVGEVAGDLQIKASNGGVSVGTAQAAVRARTAAGSLRVDAVTQGEVVLATSLGTIDVGISEGTAAWIDASTGAGTVRTGLAEADGPEGLVRTVEVRARSSAGDITIHRA